MVSKVRKERGAVAVEMAILLPILLLCIGGIVDLGRLLFVQTMVTNAAREGARMHAMKYDWVTQVVPRVNNASPGFGPGYPTRYGGPLAYTCRPRTCPGAPAPTDRAQVTVATTTFDWLILGDIMTLVGGGPPAPQPSSTATMRCLG